MSELWKKWEGQVVDHKYQLLHYAGSTDHSVVFLCEFHEGELRQAAIKFVSADVTDQAKQIAAWKQASELTHPNLLEIYGAGVCKIDDTELLYVVLEYAEENLAQVLPNRALMAEESSEMLKTVTSVLVYLHERNLTHGHIKPSNVLAIGELLKISSDTIYPANEMREMRRERSAYDAPELPGAPCTAAADVWSLGVTLVQAFTQQPAVLPFDTEADPIIPAPVRGPFLDIAANTLKRDPALRWSSAQIAEHLNPTATAMAARSMAAAAVNARSSAGGPPVAAVAVPMAAPSGAPPTSPLEVPLSKEPAVPLSKQPLARPVRPVASQPPVWEEKDVKERQAVVLPSYVIPLFAALLVVIALIMLPFALRRRTAPQANVTKSPETEKARSRAETPPAPSGSNAGAAVIIKPSTTKPTPDISAANPEQTIPITPESTPAVLRDQDRAATSSPKNANASPDKGEALDQVMPKPSAKALGTIQGTVKVGVKVHVNPAGAVTQATLENPGPSRYFADLALKAAQQWVFTPPELSGRSVASDWLVQFQFTQAGVKSTSWALGATP